MPTGRFPGITSCSGTPFIPAACPQRVRACEHHLAGNGGGRRVSLPGRSLFSLREKHEGRGSLLDERIIRRLPADGAAEQVDNMPEPVLLEDACRKAPLEPDIAVDDDLFLLRDFLQMLFEEIGRAHV